MSETERAEAAEAERDAIQAEATLLRRALIGRRTFPVGVMRAPMDERTEAIRARWDEFCFSGPSDTDRERDQVIGWLLDRMDSATARAEQAEAALAEMRERLGEPVVQWAVMLDDTESSPLPEKVARRMASDPFRTTLLTRDIYPNTAWRPSDAAPRSVLERAADEQGERPVRCGAECGEGHTYEPGSCEAAIDPDEAIARNHADAMRDWGLDEQGEREGGGDA